MTDGSDLGTVTLGGTLTAAIAVGDSTDVPHDPAVPPTFRVYGQGTGPMSNGQGSLAKLDSGVITNATNAGPIAVTSANHGLNTGTRVAVSGVLGNTAANGETTVTVANATTFTLDGTTGSGAYTSGGVWHVAGLYQLTLPVGGGDGYASGNTYYVLVSWTWAGANYAMLCPFRVV